MKGLTEFSYLRDVAKRYGMIYLVSEFKAAAKRIAGGKDRIGLKALTAAYEMIDAKNHSDLISRWIDDYSRERPGIDKRQTDFAQRVRQVFALFRYLSDERVEPFASLRVDYVERHRKPDWSHLPDELEYLRNVAEKFGIHSTEGAMREFLSNAREDEMQVLAATAERMKLNQHFEVIQEWFHRYPFDEHPEAWMVYCLIGLLDHAGLEFE